MTVDPRVPDEYGTATDDANPDPLVNDTSYADGAVTVMTPLDGVRLPAEREYVLSMDVELTATPPNAREAGVTVIVGTASVVWLPVPGLVVL